MKKIIVNENQKGLLFYGGKFAGLLNAGRYRVSSSKEIEIVSQDQPLYSRKCSLETLLSDRAVAEKLTVAEVADGALALHFVNGKFSDALTAGKYAFFSDIDKHEFQTVDLSSPEVGEDVPCYIFDKIDPSLYRKVEVAQYLKARLYIGHRFSKLLDAGTYYFWQTDLRVDVDLVDTRLTQMDILGQEILTQDKVSVRVNFVCNYRVTAFIRIAEEVNDYAEQLHVAAQLALRDCVSKYRLDDLLNDKEGVTAYVFARLKAKEKSLYVEIADAGVKDIVLPGEIRDIMNTVLVAEKRAQANVIARREEVASTRSLLNTAKLMEENQTLYKLKELEYVERICENVGNITLNGNVDILSQLVNLLQKKE